ncbi:unnamed protein product, partial [Lymnaea stagnalis]
MVVVNNLVICNTLSVFGIATNGINMVIFLKQGLDNSVNISLFGMSVSDTLSLVTLLWYNVCLNPLFFNAGLTVDPIELQHLTGCYPHDCFSRITCLITLYITAERCLCIALPLKVNQIVTPARTAVVVWLLFLLMISLLIPEYAYLRIDWKYFPQFNKTLMGLVPRTEYSDMMGLTAILYATVLLVSFVAVILLTILLIYKLRTKQKWRMEVTSDATQQETISLRNKKTIAMVVLIAIVLIVCSTPIVIVYIWMFLDVEFSFTGTYSWLYFAIGSFAQVFEVLNASINIIMFYTMSSKYRETFSQVFGRCAKSTT